MKNLLLKIKSLTIIFVLFILQLGLTSGDAKKKLKRLKF